MADSSKLHNAVRHDRGRLIARLVAEGTPVDTVDANGNTALFVAITDGPVSAVPHLLQAGADPNFRCSGGATSVHAACRRGSRALLQQLLDCGGDLRLRDASGRTPQDWALGHADPLCRRKLVAFINNKRALAYRFGDADALLDEEAGGAAMLESGSPGGAAAAASLSRRLLAGRPAVPRRRSGCTEKIRAGGGFGVVYCSPARETGVTTFVPLIASNYLYNSEDSNITWSGPQSLLQTMYWDKMKVSVKKSSPSGGRHNRASDVLIAELEKVRRLTFHPHLLWPLAVSPVQNMDDVLLVFECVHLGSLFDVLHDRGGRRLQATAVVSRGRLLLVMQQVCEALLFLHSRRWVHGCVSSHCVYLVAPCLGKLGNFEFLQRSEQAAGGGSRATASSTDVPYRPPDEEFFDYYYPWLAPEVLTGHRPTMLADLYQFAAVLWEVCTGEGPWGSADRAAVESALAEERRGLSRRPEIPPSLDTLVDAALSLDPADRDVSLEDVYHALAAIVKEGQGTVGLVVSRMEQASNAARVRSTRSVPSRRASSTVAHRPAAHRRRAASTVMDDVSEALDELITLTDEAPAYRSPPPRRVRPSVLPRGSLNTHVDLLGSKFDQMSLSSSIDPMEFTDTPRAPAFSPRTAEKPLFEACTQTDPESPPPVLRPRTGAFVPYEAGSVCQSSRVTDSLLLQEGTAKTSASRVDRQVAVQQHQSVNGSVRRTVRPCKPASHSYGLSPFAQRSRLNATATKQQQRTVTDSSGIDSARVIELSGQQQQQQTWHARGDVVESHRQHSTMPSRGTSVCRTDAAILEDLEQGEQYYRQPVWRLLSRRVRKVDWRTHCYDDLFPPGNQKELVGRSAHAEASTMAGKRDDDVTRGVVADYSLPPNLAMIGEDGDVTDSEVKSVQTEPNHSYKVEVVTQTCPVIQHTLTVTSTNLLTGEITVSEGCTGAEAVQVQWNPEQISITTPDTSLNSSAGAASFTTAVPPTSKD
ncbi:uncharacterized protein LOC119458669 isoform X2 [Dermacentor silvarum]|uniref:uncharacterized protein LOC119458669 isoform X2 n=1 Tax=Dermacentor silvarum TaxID=543639 RepID=UPI002100E4C9|nr:uncharacterized protein LOC119458669 isoform X2 [Dermacentor silvarum]